jgi:hypothetical protein
VGAQDRGAELLGLGHHALADGVVDGEAARGVVLVQPDAPEVQLAPVEPQLAADDLDRADARPEPVALGHAVAHAGAQVDVVEVGRARRPQARAGHADRPREGGEAAGADGLDPEVQALAAEAPRDAHAGGARAVVAHRGAHRHGGRARGAGQVRADLDVEKSTVSTRRR